jgi:hypothetical protein
MLLDVLALLPFTFVGIRLSLQSPIPYDLTGECISIATGGTAATRISVAITVGNKET